MGSRVNVCAVNFLKNPSSFTDDFNLEITFEVFEHLPGDLEWKLVYVGSGESRQFDQDLDSALVGPTPEGKHKFTFTAPAPNPEKIPEQDVVGVSVLLLKLSYNGGEFLNLGWWVSNEYTDEELKENPPAKPDVDKLLRTVKSDDIRVTTYPIRWNEAEAEEQPPVLEEEIDEADLMPLQDEEDKEEELADDEEDVNEDPAEVDLDASIEKDGDRPESATAVAAGDEVMDESTENAPEPEVKTTEAAAMDGGDAPLGDMTND